MATLRPGVVKTRVLDPGGTRDEHPISARFGDRCPQLRFLDRRGLAAEYRVRLHTLDASLGKQRGHTVLEQTPPHVVLRDGDDEHALERLADVRGVRVLLQEPALGAACHEGNRHERDGARAQPAQGGLDHDGCR